MNKLKHVLTRVADALRSNTTSRLAGAPETAPEGALVLGEVPNNVRGLWLQRIDLIDEGHAVDREIQDLEAKLAAAKKKRRTVSNHLRVMDTTIAVALDDLFGDSIENNGDIGMTAGWQAYAEPNSGIAGIIDKLMSGNSVNGADIFKSMPESLRKKVLPKGFEIVESLDMLPSSVQMELSGRKIDDDATILYNRDTGKVAIMSMGIGGFGLGGDMPDFLKGMMGGESDESRMAH